MNLTLRIVGALLVGGAFAWSGLAAGGRWAWLVPAAAVYAVWALARGLYLSQFRLTIDATAVRLLRNRKTIGEVRWDEISAKQTIYPSLNALAALLNAPPTPFGTRLGVPLGFALGHQIRRVLTLSPDLLLIGRSAEHVLVPLAAFSVKDRLELLARLEFDLPAVAGQIPREILEAAGASEEAAQTKMRAREYAAAIPLYEEALRAWRESGRMDQCNRVLQNIAECLQHIGRHSDAAAKLEESIALCLNLRDHRAEANARVALSRVHWVLGRLEDLDRAFEQLERAIEIHTSLGEWYLVSRFLGNQALCFERRFSLFPPDSQEARASIDRCESLAWSAQNALARPAPGVPTPEVNAQRSNLLGTLARCAFMRGQWKTAADRFAEAAAVLPEKTILADKAMHGRALFHLSGQPHTSQSDRVLLIHQSMERIDDAIRILPMHGDYDETMEVIAVRGDVFWGLGRWKEAQRDYEYVAELIERRDLPFSRPTDRARLRRRFPKLFPRLVESNLRLAAQEPERAAVWFARAFEFSERFKARSLMDILISSDLLRRLSPAARQDLEEAQAAQKRAFLQSESARLNDDPSERGRWTLMGEAEEQWKCALEAALRDAPELAELIQRRTPSLADVLAQLPDEHTGILQFSLCEGGLAVMLICRATAARPIFWILPSFIMDRVPSMVEAFEVRYNAYADAAENNQPFLAGLRRGWVSVLPGLVRSIKADIFEAPDEHGSIVETLRRLRLSRVVLIPEGLLSRLPLHAGVPEGILVTLAPNCGVLLDANRRAAGRPTEMLIVDDPDGTLPGARREGDAVQKLAEHNGVAVTRLPGAAATRDAVLRDMRGASWLHYGGHAFSSQRHPWESRLVTAGGSTLDARTLFESGAVRRGGAVIVNGCSSGLAPHDTAGEFAGLPAAFLALGCSVVLSTLWEVLQESPVILMAQFYERFLARRVSPAEALGSAIAEVRRMSLSDIAQFERRHGIAGNQLIKEAAQFPPDHPLQWAGYVIWGAGWTVDETSKHPAPPSAKVGMTWQPLVLSTAQNSPQEQLDAMAKIKTIFEEKRYAELPELLGNALRRWGPNRHILASLGEVHTLLKQPDRALEYDLQALRMDLNSPRAHYFVGCTYMDLGRPAEARESFQSALELDPGYWKAMANLGALSNSPESVLAWLRQSFQLEQKDLTAVPAPGDSDTRAAIERWESIAATPDFDLAAHRIFWAGTLVAEKDWQHVRMEVALARELPLTRAQKGMAVGFEAEVLRNTGDLRGSIACLEASLEFDASSPPVWNTLGARRYLLAIEGGTPFYESQRLLIAAIEAGRTAIACGDYSMPHRNIASAYLALNDAPAAASEAERARDMACRQIQNGPGGGLVCLGCATGGNAPAQCRDCLNLAEGLLRQIDLFGGSYRV